MNRYRRIGHHLKVTVASTQFRTAVRLKVQLDVATPETLVEQEIKHRLGSGVLPDGSKAMLHPDSHRLGDPVHHSQIVAAAKRVVGVKNVHLEKLVPVYSSFAYVPFESGHIAYLGDVIVEAIP